ncbi:GNAT family N-acetyltransferase [Flavobacterium sp. LS1R47]|uniref:GNAT family N-acetyltransferase n=1 Tax=Flavobacterium frigoritolerans TaxID=2987686 RepID=A0A9X3C8E0_9FLAO|nr:GNAT family N-acetyltransferase [Flavobacterium frigoritolerans]MCV9933582.1 GNAT family N-acetyltransferase [Flavobacterium frigoritolerans]
MTTNDLTKFRQTAEQVNFKSLLNCYCREFSNWNRYKGIPKYDLALADYMQIIKHDSFLRFDFTAIGVEIFAPLEYFSESGVHSFYFPIVARNCKTDEIQEINPLQFTELVAAFAKTDYPDIDSVPTKKRMENSIENLALYLADFETNKRIVNKPEQTFIEAEQSLILGHSVHPLPKSREGFTTKELEKYSPETGGQFQLHFFLIHPDNVIEKSAEEYLMTDYLKKEILASADNKAKGLLSLYPDWKVVPTHPWEADYLLKQLEVKEMQTKGILFSLGQFGDLYTATSSVRTVYNADSEWMYKFSLHVKITNSYRVNYLHELNRGYDASELVKTDWGKGIKKDYPEIELICDPAFIAVTYQDKVIDGFSTSVRQNPFHGAAAKKNISMVASLCQDGVLGQSPRMLNLITEAAKRQNKEVSDVALSWFKQYLKITIRPLVGIFNKYGFGSEYHQQNMLVEFDENLFPAKLYFRDNQGYFFRQGKVEELQQIIPDFGKDSRSFIAESRIIDFWGYYLLVNHLFGVINALGKSKLADEQVLLGLLYESLKAEEEADTTGLVAHLINSVKLVVKGNLLTSLNNMDEASAPRTNPAIYKSYPNPLNKFFYSQELINPQGTEAVFNRYFEKENVTITLRPVDIDKDLEMLHEWFHRDHALAIWKMNWPIKQLESYYRTLLPSDVAHSYIGEANGVPTFNIEVYWANRDIVGNYYDVLPSDYGTHQFIAPTDPKLKFGSPATQSMMDFVFGEAKVGKMVGEGSVDSLASMMNKAHVGFKIQKVIEMPDKKANLNFCYREWYWAKFPAAKDFKNSPVTVTEV